MGDLLLENCWKSLLTFIVANIFCLESTYVCVKGECNMERFYSDFDSSTNGLYLPWGYNFVKSFIVCSSCKFNELKWL